MKIIRPSYKIKNHSPYAIMVRDIEEVASVSYKSEHTIGSFDKAEKFLKNLIQNKKDESIIEHQTISIKFVVDRLMNQYLTRNLIAAISQEPSRCNNFTNSNDGLDNYITFIKPPWVEDCVLHISETCELDIDSTKKSRWDFGLLDADEDTGFLFDDISKKSFDLDYSTGVWLSALSVAEHDYFDAIQGGWSPEQAESILPFNTKSEFRMTCNLREWRNILRLKTDDSAHPQIREIMRPLLDEMKKEFPVFFEDISYASITESILLDDDLIVKLAQMSMDQDITINELINDIMKAKIQEEKEKEVDPGLIKKGLDALSNIGSLADIARSKLK